MFKDKKAFIKGVVLISILVLPSLFYLLLTTGKHNFIYLPNIIQLSDSEFTIDKTGKQYPEHQELELKFGNIQARNLKNDSNILLNNLPKKVYALHFVDLQEISDTEGAFFRMFDHQIGKRLVPFEDLEVLTIVKKPLGSNLKTYLDSKLKLKLESWQLMEVNSQDFDKLYEQVNIPPVQEKEIPVFRQIYVMDKLHKLRTGWDKQDRVFYTYDGGKEYINKLLLEDLKLLLAEYLKSLKSRKANDEK